MKHENGKQTQEKYIMRTVPIDSLSVDHISFVITVIQTLKFRDFGIYAFFLWLEPLNCHDSLKCISSGLYWKMSEKVGDSFRNE